MKLFAITSSDIAKAVGLAALQRNDAGGSDAALQGFLKTLAGHYRLHKCFRNELHAMLRDKAHSEIVNEVVLP